MGVGDDECGGIGTAASAASSLDVVGGGGWHVAEHDSLKFTHVNAEFKGGGAGQGIDFPAYELLLDLGRSFAGPLRGVFEDAQRYGIHVPVDPAVVVGVGVGRWLDPAFE